MPSNFHPDIINELEKSLAAYNNSLFWLGPAVAVQTGNTLTMSTLFEDV